MTKPSGYADSQPQEQGRDGNAGAQGHGDGEGRNTLFLVLAGQVDAPAAARLNALLEQAAPGLGVLRSASLAEALARDGNHRILVPVLMPLDHMVRDLSAGKAPDESLATWCTGIGALLVQCRRARRRIVLVDAGQVSRDALGVLAALRATLGPDLGEARAEDAEMADVLPDGMDTVGQACAPAEAMAAIASGVLAQDSHAQELADELEAMMVGPVSPRMPSRDTLGAAAGVMLGLGEERDLLRESLAHLQGEMAQHAAAHAEALTRLTDERDRLQQDLARTSEEMAQQGAAHAEALARLTDERDLLRESLTRMQAEITRQHAEDRQSMAHLTEERDLLRESLTQMRAENERLAEDLADRTEQTLLQAQIDALGRQLEDVRSLQARREAALGAEILVLGGRARAREALADSLAEANDRAMQKAQEARQLAAELAEARAQVDALHASTSWKVTKPIRAVKQGLRRP